MSANNLIYINRRTFKVYYQDCADNDGLGRLVGQGKNLEEAVDIAQKFMEKIEYGIWFVDKPKKVKVIKK
jgi:hypothetical protein